MICRQFRKDRRLNNQSAHRAGASADSDASAGCSISGRVEKNLPCLFLVVALALGVPFTFLNPPLQAPDEFAHFFRAYGVSEGQFVAHDTTSVPQGVVELVREFPPKLETDHRVREQDLIIAAHEPLQESGRFWPWSPCGSCGTSATTGSGGTPRPCSPRTAWGSAARSCTWRSERSGTRWGRGSWS